MHHGAWLGGGGVERLGMRGLGCLGWREAGDCDAVLSVRLKHRCTLHYNHPSFPPVRPSASQDTLNLRHFI